MWLGRTVADRFVLEKLVGQGGMGAVYRALDMQRGEHVAFKILLDTTSDDGLARFEREAKVIAKLEHPGIAGYVAHGTAENGVPFLAMEWLDGEDLAARILREPLDVADTITLVRRVAETIAVLHAQGIIHRDIKPQNLFLSANQIDQVKLLDFGIVALPKATQMLTQPGTMLGTAAYMAPEQIQGDAIDERADIYALGCVLFECLTGRPPFEAPQIVGIITKALFEEPPRVSSFDPTLPPWLDDLVACLLEKDRNRRPNSARELAAMLGESSPRPVAMSLALGARERRVVCIVLVAPPKAGSPEFVSASTAAASETINAHPAGLRSSSGTTSTRIAALGGGNFAALITGASSPHDLAIHAAHLALDLRAQIPSSSIVIALGRDDAGEAQSMGEVIDRAARLLPNEIETVLDQPCARLLEARFLVEHRNGRYLLNEHRDAKQAINVTQTTPFVGREREICALLGLYDNTVEDCRASCAIVTAPAGAGKTRFRDEFLKRLRKHDERVLVWSASGNAMSAGSAFAIIADATRKVMGLLRDETLETSRHKVRTFVSRWISGNNAARVIRFLGELLDLPLLEDDEQIAAARRDPILMGNQLRRAFEDLFSAICTERPVVLVLDDMQWGDMATVKLVDAVLRHLAGAPFCVFAFARPEIHETLPNAWRERKVQRIPLMPLARRPCEQLVREVLGNRATEGVVSRIIERADGNAFFLQELVRAESLGEQDVFPETVLAMVQLRIERLEAEARRVSRVASILGDTFTATSLETLVASASMELPELLANLVEQEILVRRPSTATDEPRYAFRHAFLRDAAYEMLTNSDRIRGHFRVAEMLEGKGDPLAIAKHFERGGAPARSVPWWIRVVEDLITGNDLEGAVRHGEHALGLESSAEAQGKLHLLVATALCWLARFDEGEHHATMAMDMLVPGTADWYAAAERLSWALHSIRKRDRTAALRERLAAAEPLAARASERAIAWVAIAEAESTYGNLSETGALLAYATKIADACEPSVAVTARILFATAIHQYGTNRLTQALHSFTEARALYERLGDRRNASMATSNMGSLCVSLGAYADAEQFYREALESRRRLGLGSQQAWLEHCIGRAVALMGNVEEGLATMRRAVEELQQVGFHRLYRHAEGRLAWILVAHGYIDEADQRCSKLINAEVQDTPMILAHAIQARVLLARGDMTLALESARRAHAMQKATDDKEFVVPVFVTLAKTLEAYGEHSEAMIVRREARDAVLFVAQGIDDPALRRRFFEDIPDNREALAASIGDGS